MRSVPLAIAVFSLSFAVFPNVLSPALAESALTSITKQVATGVTLTQEISIDPPLIIDVVSADLRVEGVRAETAIAQDSITGATGSIDSGSEQVEALAARHDAVAAVNGDYFSAGDPLGFGVWHGDLYSEPWKVDRAAIGIEADKKSVIFDVLAFAGHVTASDGAQFNLSAINRPVARGDANDMVVFSQLYGPVAGSRAGCTEVVLSGVNLPLAPNKLVTGKVESVTQNVATPATIPDDGLVLAAPGSGPASQFLTDHLKVGSTLSILSAVAPKPDLQDAVRIASLPRDNGGMLPSREGDRLNRVVAAWTTVDQAIGGGPRLITDGQVAIDALAEGFDSSFSDRPNPRTGVGVTKDDKLLLFTVDGRGDLSHGATLPEMASIMLRYGVVNGINLDGGGSTTMAVGGVIVDYPSMPGAGRRVADMLVVYAKSNRHATPMTALIDNIPVVKVGSTTRLTIEVDGKPIYGSDSRIVWRGAVEGSVGFVSQDGVFHATNAGVGHIVAVVDGMKVTRDVTVLGVNGNAAPYLLTARIDPVAGSVDKSLVSARLATADGTAGAGITVNLSVKGGTADKTNALTDEDGVARFNVTWEESGGSVTVMSGAQTPLTLYRDSLSSPDSVRPVIPTGPPATDKQTAPTASNN